MAAAMGYWRPQVQRAAALLASQMDNRGVGKGSAQRIVDTLEAGAVRAMAIEYLIEQAGQLNRTRSLKVERAAEERVVSRPKPKPREGLTHGSFNQRYGAIPAGCTCDQCAAAIERDNDFEAKKIAKLSSLLTEYRDQLRITWTDELLKATFAMPDGSRVLWGEATVDQHRERVSMLMGNVAGNLEAAARHEKAVEEIEAASVQTLNELVLVST